MPGPRKEKLSVPSVTSCKAPVRLSLFSAMNSNHIKRDGFSNPVTAALFRRHWTEKRREREIREESSCWFCCFGCFVSESGWMLCLNPDSPHCDETVCLAFSCMAQRGRAN